MRNYTCKKGWFHLKLISVKPQVKYEAYVLQSRAQLFMGQRKCNAGAAWLLITGFVSNPGSTLHCVCRMRLKSGSTFHSHHSLLSVRSSNPPQWQLGGFDTYFILHCCCYVAVEERSIIIWLLYTIRCNHSNFDSDSDKSKSTCILVFLWRVRIDQHLL